MGPMDGLDFGRLVELPMALACAYRIWCPDLGGAFVGYVMRTKVACFDTVLEKVLSKTSPYMPPSPVGTSYVPNDTWSASHFPCHCTCFSPIADSFSNTTVLSFLDVDNPRPRVVGTSSPGVEGPASKVAEDGRCGVAPVAFPGCLNMPKLMDFL
jgi:hypothetical protein